MSTAEEIAKLASLRDSGVISEKEFQSQKKVLLAGQSSSMVRMGIKRMPLLGTIAIVVVVIAATIFIGIVRPSSGLKVALSSSSVLSNLETGYPYANTPCIWPGVAVHAKANAQNGWDPCGKYVNGKHHEYDWGIIPKNGNSADASMLRPPSYYAYRNCTDYVAWALGQLGVSLAKYKGLGNAGSWAYPPASYGLTVNTTPAIGSVAVASPPKKYGHVALVVAYDGTNITVDQYNYYGDGAFTQVTLPPSRFNPPFTKFVHFENYEKVNLPGAITPQTQAAAPATPPKPVPSSSLTVQPAGSSNQLQPASGSSSLQSPGSLPAPNLSQYAGDIVQWNGDTKQQKTSWLVTSDLKREWIPTSAIYNCLVTEGATGPVSLSSSILNQLTDQTGVWASCSLPPAPTTTTTTPAAPTPTTYSETVGGNTNTWTNYSNAGGNQGPTISNGTTVQVACKVQGFRVQDGDTWWYRIASGPWSNSYYASADAFYNNGQTSGSLLGTPYVDNAVPNC